MPQTDLAERASRLIVENHYTRSIPSGKRRFYEYEDAVVLFAIPANKNISRWLLKEDNVVWELSRLWAPDGHRPNLLTEALSRCVAQFRIDEPKVEALISYADPNAGHHGGVYRAASWVPLGRSEEARCYFREHDNQIVSRRAFHSGARGLKKAEIEALGYVERKLPGKHRFAKGLSRKARKMIASHPCAQKK